MPSPLSLPAGGPVSGAQPPPAVRFMHGVAGGSGALTHATQHQGLQAGASPAATAAAGTNPEAAAAAAASVAAGRALPGHAPAHHQPHLPATPMTGPLAAATPPLLPHVAGAPSPGMPLPAAAVAYSPLLYGGGTNTGRGGDAGIALPAANGALVSATTSLYMPSRMGTPAAMSTPTMPPSPALGPVDGSAAATMMYGGGGARAGMAMGTPATPNTTATAAAAVSPAPLPPAATISVAAAASGAAGASQTMAGAGGHSWMVATPSASPMQHYTAGGLTGARQQQHQQDEEEESASATLAAAAAAPSVANQLGQRGQQDSSSCCNSSSADGEGTDSKQGGEGGGGGGGEVGGREAPVASSAAACGAPASGAASVPCDGRAASSPALTAAGCAAMSPLPAAAAPGGGCTAACQQGIRHGVEMKGEWGCTVSGGVKEEALGGSVGVTAGGGGGRRGMDLLHSIYLQQMARQQQQQQKLHFHGDAPHQPLLPSTVPNRLPDRVKLLLPSFLEGCHSNLQGREGEGHGTGGWAEHQQQLQQQTAAQPSSLSSHDRQLQQQCNPYPHDGAGERCCCQEGTAACSHQQQQQQQQQRNQQQQCQQYDPAEVIPSSFSYPHEDELRSSMNMVAAARARTAPPPPLFLLGDPASPLAPGSPVLSNLLSPAFAWMPDAMPGSPRDDLNAAQGGHHGGRPGDSSLSGGSLDNFAWGDHQQGLMGYGGGLMDGLTDTSALPHSGPLDKVAGTEEDGEGEGEGEGEGLLFKGQEGHLLWKGEERDAMGLRGDLLSFEEEDEGEREQEGWVAATLSRVLQRRKGAVSDAAHKKEQDGGMEEGGWSAKSKGLEAADWMGRPLPLPRAGMEMAGYGGTDRRALLQHEIHVFRVDVQYDCEARKRGRVEEGEEEGLRLDMPSKRAKTEGEEARHSGAAGTVAKREQEELSEGPLREGDGGASAQAHASERLTEEEEEAGEHSLMEFLESVEPLVVGMSPRLPLSPRTGSHHLHSPPSSYLPQTPPNQHSPSLPSEYATGGCVREEEGLGGRTLTASASTPAAVATGNHSDELAAAAGPAVTAAAEGVAEEEGDSGRDGSDGGGGSWEGGGAAVRPTQLPPQATGGGNVSAQADEGGAGESSCGAEAGGETGKTG